MTVARKPALSLAEFDRVLDDVHMRGQWQYDALLEKVRIDGPPPGGIPFIWKWDLVRGILDQMCEVMPESNTARRNFTFINPDPGIAATTQSMAFGMQIITPGETAWAHRHSINALRFVVDGSPDLWTAVDGEKLVMEDNDLIITPAYTWHDHHNESDKHGVWIDILDLGLFSSLRQMFYETFGESMQPLRSEPGDLISRRSSPIRPAWEAQQSTRIPFRYAWRDVQGMLSSLVHREGSPFDGVILHYSHPITGGPTMPTLDCFAQQLRPGLRTQRHRHTSSTVYYAIDGEGTTVVGDQELEWSAGDSFVVPSWSWHEHRNRSASKPATLFSTTDAPALKALGMYREEPGDSLFSGPYPPVPADLAVHSRGQ